MFILTFLLSLIKYSTGYVHTITWDGTSTDLIQTTILVGDSVQWPNPNPEAQFTFQSNFFQATNPDPQLFESPPFFVLGSYIYSLNNVVYGSIAVVGGLSYNPETTYYNLITGDIFRWEWDENSPALNYQTSFPGTAIYDIGLYDFQFPIPGYYQWFDNNQWYSIHVSPGFALTWSGSISPFSAPVAAGSVIRLYWDHPELHSVNVTADYGFGMYTYSLGANADLGHIVNVSIPTEVKSVTITSNVNPDLTNMNYHFYTFPIQFVYWTRTSSGRIDCAVNETLRFYVTDNIRHNVRITGGPSMQQPVFVSGSFKDPGQYVDIVLTHPGVYNATCDYHRGQFITIVVGGGGNNGGGDGGNGGGDEDDHTSGEDDDDDDRDDDDDDRADDDYDYSYSYGHHGGGGHWGHHGCDKHHQSDSSKSLLHVAELSLFMVGLLGLGGFLLDVSQDNGDNHHHRHHDWNGHDGEGNGGWNDHNNNNNGGGDQNGGWNDNNNYNNDNNNNNNNFNAWNTKATPVVLDKSHAVFRSPTVNKNVQPVQSKKVEMKRNTMPNKLNHDITNYAMEQLQKRIQGK